MQWSREGELNQFSRNEGWFSQSAQHNAPLTRYTVLDYFKHTDFYDPMCINERVLVRGLPPSAQLDEIGTEYEVDTSAPADAPVFAIRRQQRLSRTSVILEAIYVVVARDIPRDETVGRTEPIPKGSVFPMPDLHSVLARNLHASFYHLSSLTENMARRLQIEAAGEGTDTFDAPDPSATSTAPTDAAAGAEAEVAGANGEAQGVDLTKLPVSEHASQLLLRAVNALERAVEEAQAAAAAHAAAAAEAAAAEAAAAAAAAEAAGKGEGAP